MKKDEVRRSTACEHCHKKSGSYFAEEQEKGSFLCQVQAVGVFTNWRERLVSLFGVLMQRDLEMKVLGPLNCGRTVK